MCLLLQLQTHKPNKNQIIINQMKKKNLNDYEFCYAITKYRYKFRLRPN